jgi:hypothetical protein
MRRAAGRGKSNDEMIIDVCAFVTNAVAVSTIVECLSQVIRV